MNKPSKTSKAHSKKDIIVAVRMPKGMVEELRDIQKINHFMDISDEIRYVLRKYCTPSQVPKIGSDGIESALLENKRKEKLIEDLNNIIAQLKESAGGKA